MAKSEVIVTNVLLGIVVVVLVVIVVLCVTRKNEGFNNFFSYCFNTAKNCKDLKECCKKNTDEECYLWKKSNKVSASNMKQYYKTKALDYIGRFSDTIDLKNDKDNWGKKCKYE